MRTFLQTIGVICALAAFGMITASLWVGDWRWFVTGLLTAIAAYGVFVWASHSLNHEDVCEGC